MSSATPTELQGKIQANRRRVSRARDPQLLAAMSALRARVTAIDRGDSPCPSPLQDMREMNDTWQSGSIPGRAPSGDVRTPQGSKARSSLTATCQGFDQQLTARLSAGVLGEFNEFGHPFNSTKKLVQPSDLRSTVRRHCLWQIGSQARSCYRAAPLLCCSPMDR